MKYRLINKQTNEEHLCDKVTIDGFDYYVSDEYNDLGGWHIDKEFKILSNVSRFNVVPEMKEVKATNNPNIDIPKVVDEVEILAKEQNYDLHNSHDTWAYFGFKKGYNKSQETHPFSEEDMIEFAEFVSKYPDKNRNHIGQMLHAKSKYDGAERTIDLLTLWKESRPKTVYYE